MSIKYKLTLMMMGIGLAAVLLTVTAISAYLIYDMRDSKQKELAVMAALTGDRNSAALVFTDNARARANLDIFHLNPSIKVACIYDAKGDFFAGYESKNAAHLICPPKNENVTLTIPEMFAAYQDIQQKGMLIGHILVVSDTREIDAYVHKTIVISSSAALMVFLVTLLLAVYFQRTISGPILELVATAESITQRRDYTLEAKAAYPDETGTLARAFNAMLGEVRKRDSELMQHNETLEQKVLDRTRQLELAKQKAEEANEAKSEFLRNMSHEFRTPLHAIISFSSYGIKEHENTGREQLCKYFDLIQKGAERLSRLVNEVLDLARLEHGEHMFFLKKEDMRELASRAAEMAQPQLREKNISLNFEHLGESSMAVCDHDKIVQVITNLLGNAIKFTPIGSTITIRIAAVMQQNDDARMVVSVIDEGVGIPGDEKEMIFESFRQSSRTNNGAGGTGLGLAICRGIIDAHKGVISADNNIKKPGAIVTFNIPASMKEGRYLVHIHPVEEKNENAA